MPKYFGAEVDRIRLPQVVSLAILSLQNPDSMTHQIRSAAGKALVEDDANGPQINTWSVVTWASRQIRLSHFRGHVTPGPSWLVNRRPDI